MATTSKRRRATGYRSASEWPAWTDEVRYTIPADAGPFEEPSEDDRRWAAMHLNEEECQAQELPPDDMLERAAHEAAAQDLYERGVLHI